MSIGKHIRAYQFFQLRIFFRLLLQILKEFFIIWLVMILLLKNDMTLSCYFWKILFLIPQFINIFLSHCQKNVLFQSNCLFNFYVTEFIDFPHSQSERSGKKKQLYILIK